MPSNKAAWITQEGAKPFEIKEAPYPTPGVGEVVVKNAAVAMNPIDWKMQDFSFFPLPYPNILGSDLAGEVVEVGEQVTNVKKGQMVFSHCVQLATGKPQNGAFQLYTAVPAVLTTPLLPSVDAIHGCVLPLAIDTAAHGLYDKEFLKLQYPSTPPKPTGEVFLVWGGSSSVGTATIQLAVASGYEVVTTASKRNIDLCKSLGATHVLDYGSKTVIDEIVDVLKSKTVAGAYDSIGQHSTAQSCAEVLSRSKGSKFVACVLEPPDNLPGGVRAKFVLAAAIEKNEIGPMIHIDYLPKAMEKGFVPVPEPLVVGKGLETIQKAVETQKKGVSARKVVVEL